MLLNTSTFYAAIVPLGDYYKLKDAEQIVSASNLSAKRKSRMLQLLTLVPQKKPLYLAFKELNVRNRDDILIWFAKLGVPPVTISKRENLNYLKNLYYYLEL